MSIWRWYRIAVKRSEAPEISKMTHDLEIFASVQFRWARSRPRRDILPPPANGGTEAGDILLNSSVNWQINSNYDLMTVVAHEFGHALGLGESTVSTSVMYGTYNGIKQVTRERRHQWHPVNLRYHGSSISSIPGPNATTRMHSHEHQLIPEQ